MTEDTPADAAALDTTIHEPSMAKAAENGVRVPLEELLEEFGDAPPTVEEIAEARGDLAHPAA